MTMIFIVSGPSGAGEDSVIEAVQKRGDYNRVITTVTRKMRSGEEDGRPYYFISRERFEEMLKNDEFVEWAIVYDDYRGATKLEIERLLNEARPIIWKVDWQGVATIKKHYPEAVSIFITPPSYEVLEERLKRRGTETDLEIKRREAFTKKWLLKRDMYNHVVVNADGELDAAIAEVERIIREAYQERA